VQLSLDGRLAIYGAGPDWQPHELVPDVLVRAWPSPKGASYQILEFRALAGAQVPMMSRPTASQLHVLMGSILIRRHDQAGTLQVCEAGDSARFAAAENHGVLVLTDSHTLIVFSTDSPK
jgi:hypothetical protein